MRIGQSSGHGYTIFELLIVIAMLGIVAAIVVTTVIRFLNSGEEEAREAEYRIVVDAIEIMKFHNNLLAIPHPRTTEVSPCQIGTQDMTLFPDDVSGKGPGLGAKIDDVDGVPYVYTGPPGGRDKTGFLLFEHDSVAGDGQINLVNYVSSPTTTSCYEISVDDTVREYKLDGTETTP